MIVSRYRPLPPHLRFAHFDPLEKHTRELQRFRALLAPLANRLG